MADQIFFENIRAIIILIGWPILILGSILIIWSASKFYRRVGKSVVGKLVLGMVTGWLITMYSLGITSTALMFASLHEGVLLVLPVFALWMITMGIIAMSVERWGREAVVLNTSHAGFENLVHKRTEELEKAYAAQIQNERELRKLREQFVFIAAHELRTPVTAIEWGLSTMLDDPAMREYLTPECRKLLENIREKNKNLLALVADLLNVARIEKGTLKLESENMALPSTITKAIDEVTPLARQAGISISAPILISGELPLVRAHPIYLKEILQNLLTNAIHYNKPGGWVKVEGRVQDKEFVISVQDNGIGMAEESMKNLFKEFYRVKSPETKNIEGTGLGLYITKQLLELMQGRVWVESKKGEGSTFSFAVPLVGYPKSEIPTATE